MRTIPTPRLTRITGLVLAALVATTGAALAVPPEAPDPTSKGKVGSFRIVESQELPAATCTYGDPESSTVENSLMRMGLAAPRVKAAAGRTSQKVAWRLVVQFSDDDGVTWGPYARSAWTSGTAKPTVAASLARRSARLRTWDDTLSGPAAWRAKAEIRWYAADGTTISGRAAIWPTWYLMRQDPYPSFTATGPSCGWTTG